jgi:hypothetical protein
MRRRKLLVALAGLAVVVAAGALLLSRFHQDRLTFENLNSLYEGMSLADVVAILGPPGDYRTGDTFYAKAPELAWQSPIWQKPRDYGNSIEGRSNDRAKICLSVDSSGRLASGTYSPMRTVDHGFWGNLRWRLERQWKRWFP